jgi:hypothetical protein
MSRVFTIHFSFKEKTYSALVSFSSKEHELSYLVRYLDEEVETLIPGNKLLVSLLQGVEYPQLQNKLAHNLVYKTTEVINEYLRSHEN